MVRRVGAAGATAIAFDSTPADTTQVPTGKTAEVAPLGGLFPEKNAPHAQEKPNGAVKAHGALLLQRQFDSVAGFREVWARVVGAKAVSDLKAAMTKTPVVLIAGDQLTGKSTQAKAVAQLLGGQASGTGSVVRKLAAERGLSIENMAKALAKEPETDAQIDYRAALAIAKGDAATFESRLAGHLGLFLKSLGRENLVTVYLKCAPRERALRYVDREVGNGARARLEPQLAVADDADLAACLRGLGTINDPAALKVSASFSEIAQRDASDYSRLKALYDIDYQDQSVFDVVVDTSGKTPAEVEAEISAAVKARVAVATANDTPTLEAADLHARVQGGTAGLPALLDDWKRATVEAVIEDVARATFAHVVDQALADAAQRKGAALTRREARPIIEVIEQDLLPPAVKRVAPGIDKDDATRARAVSDAIVHYRAITQAKKDPFTPLAAGDPAARAKEIVLWEDADVMVVADKFAPGPKALVIPKQAAMFPVDLSAAQLAELARVAKAVSETFTEIAGTPRAETWINPPQHLMVRQLHVHVRPELPEWDPDWDDATLAAQSNGLYRAVTAVLAQRLGAHK